MSHGCPSNRPPSSDGDQSLHLWPVQQLLGVDIHALTMKHVISIIEDTLHEHGSLLISVVNAAKIVNMRRDEPLRRAVLAADLVLADGMSVVWASRFLNRPLPQRVTGIDLMDEILRCAHESQRRVYFLGATDQVLKEAVARIRATYPGIVVAGGRNGYFQPAEEAEVVSEIQAAQPDVLLVAMSSPKKEEFLARRAAEMKVSICHGVGGAFDVVACKVKRAPAIWQRWGLEWLYRVVQEPRRMWRRYLVTNSLFCAMVLAEKLKHPPPPRTSRPVGNPR